MKKFSYRLQRVLEVREKTEEDRKRDLTDRRAELQQVVDLREQLDKKRTSSFLETESDVMFLLHGSYLARLLQEIEAVLSRIKECEDRVREAEVLFLEARHEAEVLRKLREKKLTQYNKNLELHESQVLDEIATLRYGRE